jgi:RHS repeat-associated protein
VRDFWVPHHAGLACGDFSSLSGEAASFGYSADRLQMTSLSYAKSGTTLFGLNYYYKTDSTNCSTGTSGNNGQIQCISDTVDSGRTAKYTYDALARLSTAQTSGSTPYPQWGLSETYDRYGNRTLQNVTAGTGPYSSVSVSTTTNRLTGSPYTYDSNGNLTNDGSNSLVYDAENRLTSINSAANEYIYDGNSLRVKKCTPNCTNPTSRTVYIFSGSKVIAEYDNGAAVGSPTREYLYAGGSLLARIDGSTTKYYHRDHLSNRLTTDSSGTALEQKGHFPFGEDWYQGSDKLKFTTYERESESGNDYAMARSYVNRLGRFSSADPLAGNIFNPQRLDRYTYVLSDSINGSDPFGLDGCDSPERFKTAAAYAAMCGEGGASIGGGGGSCQLDSISTPCSILARIVSAGAVALCLDPTCWFQADLVSYLPGQYSVANFRIPMGSVFLDRSGHIAQCGSNNDCPVGVTTAELYMNLTVFVVLPGDSQPGTQGPSGPSGDAAARFAVQMNQKTKGFGQFLGVFMGASVAGGLGFAYFAGSGILAETLDMVVISHQGLVYGTLDFADGYLTPFFPGTIVGSIGYALGYTGAYDWVKAHFPGKR